MEQELALRPFLPAKDFEVSKRFYQALGFTVTLEDKPIAILKTGSVSFILQDFYNKDAAENQMVQLLVRNVDHWWERVTAAELETNFGVWAPRPPAMQPWGLKVGFFADPSGVLWHIVESVF